MKVIDILNNTDKAVFSFELVPPLKGGDINKIYEAIEPLIALAPPFINITFHRDEVVYREYPDGTIKKVTVTKRPGSVIFIVEGHVEELPTTQNLTDRT